jgi:peptide/nickel transport system permease protein
MRHLRARSGQAMVVIGLAMLTVLIAATAFAPFIAPFDPSATSPDSLAGPSVRHWLGTDSSAVGRRC